MITTEDRSVIDEIRDDRSEAVESRRKIAALAATGLVDFSFISLYQLGYIKHMPDLPGEVFDSEKVNSSKDAVLLGIPDAPISLLMYAATVLLATAATRQTRYSRYFDLLMGSIILGQAAGGAHYLYNMAKVQKKVCLYCVAGALINFVSVKPLLDLYRASR
ncbi:vitamin K epoxide reductase family protein [Telluribacter sp. SYSU D00476]|uniref:vitamin K epoxide reductase family protein n=1 Tax=Telluribacter sp. SYSU D00476 TaxID=2811430 RepID=UPI001FF12EF6|nr:vitamin K epoxide reductase family protein [Telluribacter sp. SYSU D00476]